MTSFWRTAVPYVLQSIAYPPTRFVFAFFLRFEVRGLENLEDIDIKNKGVIFAANHTSEWDPIIVTAALPWGGRFSPLYYTSLVSSFYKDFGWRNWIYGGIFFRFWGAYPVYKGLKNYERSLVNHVDILNDKKSLCVFPEGERTANGKPQKAHGGVAYLSDKCDVPVVPVGISNIHKISTKEFFRRKRRVVVTFGKPVYKEDLFENLDKIEIPDYKIASEKIMSEVRKLVV